MSLVLGPLPTLGHLVLLPAIRTCSFLYRDLIPFAVGVVRLAAGPARLPAPFSPCRGVAAAAQLTLAGLLFVA